MRIFISSTFVDLRAERESAVEALSGALPSGANIAVIPEGPYVLAKALAHAAVR